MHNDIHPGVFIGFGWAIIWIGGWFLFYQAARRERMRLYEMIEKATAEGRTLPPEILGRLSRRIYTWHRDVRTGLILIAIALGLVIGGLLNFYDYSRAHADAQLFYGPFKLFPVPLLLGVAFLVMGWLRRKDEIAGR